MSYLVLLGVFSLIAIFSIGAAVVFVILGKENKQAAKERRNWIYVLAAANIVVAFICWVLSRTLRHHLHNQVVEYRMVNNERRRRTPFHVLFNENAILIAFLAVLLFLIGLLFEHGFDNVIVGYIFVSLIVCGIFLTLTILVFNIHEIRVYVAGLLIPPFLMARLGQVLERVQRRNGEDEGRQLEMAQRSNVHSAYDRSEPHRRDAVSFMNTYLRDSTKTSRNWQQELQYPFSDNPYTFSHTPSSILDSNNQGFVKRFFITGLRNILERDSTATDVQNEITNIETTVMPCDLRLDRGKVAIMCLLFMYNAAEINVDWARMVVSDAANAYGPGNATCADGLAERMVLFFFQIVSSRCMSEEPMSSPINKLCEIIKRQPGESVLLLNEHNFNQLLSEWGMTPDEHYADDVAATRRAKLIRFMVDRLAPQHDLEQRVAEMVDGMRLDFNADSKVDAVPYPESDQEEKEQ